MNSTVAHATEHLLGSLFHALKGPAKLGRARHNLWRTDAIEARRLIDRPYSMATLVA